MGKKEDEAMEQKVLDAIKKINDEEERGAHQAELKKMLNIDLVTLKVILNRLYEHIDANTRKSHLGSGEKYLDFDDIWYKE